MKTLFMLDSMILHYENKLKKLKQERLEYQQNCEKAYVIEQEEHGEAVISS